MSDFTGDRVHAKRATDHNYSETKKGAFVFMLLNLLRQQVSFGNELDTET